MDRLTRRLLMAAAAAAIISYGSYSPGTLSGNSTTIAINKPAGAAVGDTLVAIVASSGADTWTPPSGWTKVYDQAAAPGISVVMRTVDGSEGASFTFTCSTSRTLLGQILLIKGSAQFDAIGTVVNTTSNTDVVMSAITAASGILLGIAVGTAQSARDYSAPAGMTATGPVILNTNATLRVFYELIGGGSTGTRTTTPSGGGGINYGVLAAIKAA